MDQKIEIFMKGVEDLSCLKDLSKDEIEGVMLIFNHFNSCDYPNFKSSKEFDQFINNEQDRIESLKDVMDSSTNPSLISIIADKGLIIGCYYLYPENRNFTNVRLTPELQKKFIKIFALATPKERKEIGIIARQYIYRIEEGKFNGNISTILNL